MAFEIGDKVIYPNHGLGIVERIETKTIMGTTCGFYQVRMANETTVFVPVDNVDGVGLRRCSARPGRGASTVRDARLLAKDTLDPIEADHRARQLAEQPSEDPHRK